MGQETRLLSKKEEGEVGKRAQTAGKKKGREGRRDRRRKGGKKTRSFVDWGSQRAFCRAREKTEAGINRNFLAHFCQVWEARTCPCIQTLKDHSWA